VLCEKPLATSSKDVGAMFAAARRLGRTLVEGFPYRSQPYIRKLKQLLHAGAIGRPRMMHAAIGFTISDVANIRFDRARGGGVLLDAGTYPVSLVRLVAEECPSRVGSLARWHTSGVDETLVASLEHPGGLLAQISCSLATAVYRQASIVGTEGSIQLSFLNSPPLDRPVVLRVARGQAWDAPVELIEILACNGFRAEAESFERLIREDSSHWTGASPEESLDIMLTLEAILDSARSRQTVEIVK
jgi:D-xylose 1-dehydrogenase (NADP+, D-xylono-1,5-lactone-forming)